MLVCIPVSSGPLPWVTEVTEAAVLTQTLLVVGKRHLQNDFINLWKIVFSIYVPAVVLLGDSEMNEIELLFSAVFYSLVKKNEDVNKER